MLHYDQTTFWQKFTRKRKRGIIIHDYTNPVSWKLPCRLEVGDEASFIFPICEKIQWAGEILRMGLHDSFGRTHWCPKREALDVQQKYAEAMKAAWQNNRVQVPRPLRLTQHVKPDIELFSPTTQSCGI